MKNFIRKTFVVILMMTIFVVGAIPTYACTGVIVGKDLTESGNYIFGRTEDLEVNHNKVFKIHLNGEFKEGSVIKDVSYDEKLGYEYVMPFDSYRFTSVSDTTPEYGYFDEAGFNEKGVIADMTVSASANDKILEVDPYVEDGDMFGISEAIITTVVLSSADSAINGIKLIANEVATKGSIEGNGLVVADKDSVWYMEIYSGHQFVAMKYPSDKFSVFPNTFWLNEAKLDIGEESENYFISKDGNYIYSKGIFDTAISANTFKGDKDNNIIDLVGSYNPEEYRLSNISRVYSGIKHFNPEADVTTDTKVFEFLQEGNHKISLEEVLQFTRNRMENVGIVGNEFGRDVEINYPIGNRNTMESHIFETNEANPVNVPGVMYLAIGSPLVSPYVPYFPNQTDSIKEVGNLTNDPSLDSVYWMAMDILFMVEANREPFMEVVNKHLTNAQKQLLVNSSALSDELATGINLEKANLGFETLKNIREELVPLYEKFLESNDYEVVFNARKKTAAFAGTSMSVPAGTFEKHINLKIGVEPLTFNIVDDYSNDVEALNNEVKISLPLDVLMEDSEFEYPEGTNFKFEKAEDSYIITTNATSFSLKEKAETQVENTNKSNNGLLAFAGILLVVGGILFYRKNKK